MFSVTLSDILEYVGAYSQDADEDVISLLISSYIEGSGEITHSHNRWIEVVNILTQQEHTPWFDEVGLGLIELASILPKRVSPNIKEKLDHGVHWISENLEHKSAKILAQGFQNQNNVPRPVDLSIITEYTSRLLVQYLDSQKVNIRDENEYYKALLTFFTITNNDNDPAYSSEDGAALSLQFLARMSHPDSNLFENFSSRIAKQISDVELDFFKQRRNEELIDLEELIEVIS